MTRADPFSYLNAAAFGDLTAQRALADAAMQMAADGEDDPLSTIRDGLIFARLAAAHGHEADRARVLTMLTLAASLSERDDDAAVYSGEALAMISQLADEGVETADTTLSLLAEQVSSDVLLHAKDYAERLAAAGIGGR